MREASPNQERTWAPPCEGRACCWIISQFGNRFPQKQSFHPLADFLPTTIGATDASRSRRKNTPMPTGWRTGSVLLSQASSLLAICRDRLWLVGTADFSQRRPRRKTGCGGALQPLRTLSIVTEEEMPRLLGAPRLSQSPVFPCTRGIRHATSCRGPRRTASIRP